MPNLRSVDQLGLDERIVEDPELEAALEQREAHKRSLGAVRKMYDGAHAAALVVIERLELPDAAPIRVGRFRLERSTTPPRNVTFETKGSSRVRIRLIDEGE